MNTDRIRFLVIHSMLAIAVLGLLLGVSARKSLAQGFSGAVYTLTNQPTGNSVIVFDRAADGTLTLAGSYPTGEPAPARDQHFPQWWIHWDHREPSC
jgi:hypothetical protein